MFVTDPVAAVLPRPPAWVLALCAFLLMQTAMPARAACEAGGELQACTDLGGFTATARRVTVADKAIAKYSVTRTVRTLLRLQNTGTQPLILALRVGSMSFTDDTGQAYKPGAASTVVGIGLAGRNEVDPQLQIAPGGWRDFQVEAQTMYHTKPPAQVLGQVYTLELALVELRLQGAQRVEVLRDHPLSLAGIRGRQPGAAFLGQGAEQAAGAADLVNAIKALSRNTR